MNLTITVLTAVSHLSAAGTPSASSAHVAAGFNGCEIVDAAKPLASGIEANAINFYKFAAPTIAIVCFVIALVMSMADKGGNWFKRFGIVIGGLIVIGAVIGVVHGIGTAVPC